ncbi:MAG: hypothetical protein HC834_05215 [Rhodospirillales bacterium]|nr:hypothetical protein [Rhodospirillales bacterium]
MTRIGDVLDLGWILEDAAAALVADVPSGHRAAILDAARRHHLPAVSTCLDALQRESPHHAEIVRFLRRRAEDRRFDDIVDIVAEDVTDDV